VSSRSTGFEVANVHVPVLLDETMELLAVRASGRYLDGTCGLGGHSLAILERSAPDGRLLAVDRDARSLALAAERLAPFGDRVSMVHADFRDVARGLGAETFDGALVDLGISSAQLDDPSRGFSFRVEGPLDMRMDQDRPGVAAELVNRLPERALADLIYQLGEERASRRIARFIVASRRRKPFETTTELAEVVRRAVGHRGVGRRGGRGLDPATRTFQALRISVNRELEGLGESLRILARHLAPHGRLVAISFHSLEDREVKNTFRELSASGFRVLTRKPVRPSEAQIAANPRCRSARLRALEREAA
jgi:16S rRNA (cytosine1402-N4)-methyltransferase